MARPRSFDSTDTLDAIAQRFWETGYAGTSVDDLTACTGLGKGSLYGAFGSKHEMYVRTVREYAETTAKAFESALSGDDAGAFRRLRALLRGTARDLCASRLGCLLGKAVSERGAQDDEIDAIAHSAFDRMRRALRACIRQAQRAGDVDAGVDAKKVAELLFALVRGMDSLAKAGASDETVLAVSDTALALLRR